jgi:hypothetical protein
LNEVQLKQIETLPTKTTDLGCLGLDSYHPSRGKIGVDMNRKNRFLKKMLIYQHSQSLLPCSSSTRLKAAGYASACAILIFTGCVSVKIAGTGGKSAKSQGVDYQAPASPFVESKLGSADRSWQNLKTGGSIGFHSACDTDTADLEVIQKDIEQELQSLKNISQTRKDYNGREALFSTVEGRVDGVSTRINSVIFRKNGCAYTLTLASLSKSFERDLPYFQKFLETFNAN